MKKSPAKTTAVASIRQGIQSIEVAAPLLKVLASSQGSLSLSTLSSAASMPAAKAHRYLVSLIRVGLIEQHSASGEYDLGPLALELGLASLNRLDAVKLADEAMLNLRDSTNETVALATWGNFGPTYIRMMPSRRPVMINLQIGSVMPLTYTATGLCFATFLPPEETEDLIQTELAQNRRKKLNAPHTKSTLTPLLEETKLHGLARIIGTKQEEPFIDQSIKNRAAECLPAGFISFSAPIFNHENHIRFALTVVGSALNINSQWCGPLATELKKHAKHLSMRLGYRVR